MCFFNTALVVSNDSIKMYLNYLPLKIRTVVTKQKWTFSYTTYESVCLKISQNKSEFENYIIIFTLLSAQL